MVVSTYIGSLSLSKSNFSLGEFPNEHHFGQSIDPSSSLLAATATHPTLKGFPPWPHFNKEILDKRDI